MPDIMLLPAIASFFGVSIDELLEYNLYEVQKNIEAIVEEHSKLYDTDKAKCERVLRDGLRKYPGNEILLNCLVGVLPVPERSGEVIDLCKALVESTRDDAIKYDAYRIMAEAYASQGEYGLAKAAIENIPEIYFSKLQVMAVLLKDEDAFSAAVRHKNLAFEDLLDMLELLAQHYIVRGEPDKAKVELQMARDIIFASREDPSTAYTKQIYPWAAARLPEIEEKLCRIQ